jgi:hypothetical protein
MTSTILSHLDVVAPEAAMLLLLGLLYAFPRTRGLAHRAVRTGRAMAGDRTLPLWARYGFVLASLPIPGPFDEVVGGVLVVALLRGRHAGTVRRHWAATGPQY